MTPTLSQVENLTRSAGEILQARFGAGNQIQQKGAFDLVTEADLLSENYLVGAIRDQFPEHTIITEESGQFVGDAEFVWYLDPLDGTLNYAHGVPIFSVSVAFAVGGKVQLAAVYNPVQGEFFSAARGQGARLNGDLLKVSQVDELAQALLVTGFPNDVHENSENNLAHFAHFTRRSHGVRRLGSAALDLCYLAAGRFDGYWEIRINSYDIAAGALVVTEAGGIATNLTGSPAFLTLPTSILAGNPSIYPKLLAYFNR
jgi:myo-inositol-1(or 4)-monophosphatase